MKIKLKSTDTLLLIDIQNDFLPGGSLAVPAGEQILTPVHALLHGFQERQLPIFASRDWHPMNHCSFTEEGGQWPVHCVQNTPGAAFALTMPEEVSIVSKATDINTDAYSAFNGTTLSDLLQLSETKRLFIAGLATDYCVYHTVLDALALDYQVVLLEDCIAAVNVNPSDGTNALEAMRRAGAKSCSSQDIELTNLISA